MFNEAGQFMHNVLYRKGKGGGGAPAPPQTFTDPATGMTFTDPNALNAEIQQNQAQAAATAAQNTANQQATAAQNEATFQTNRQQAYNDALQSVMQTFQGQGVNPANYMGYITPALQQASNSVPDLASNISSYFPTSLGQTILNQATGDQRTQLGNTLNSFFTPTFANTLLPDSTIDPAVNTILNNQFDPLTAQLTNAMNRGTLNQVGFNAASAKEAQDRAAAQSQLRSLGQNILSTDRTSLGNIASGARSDIANMTLGQNIDPNQYFSQANQQAASDVSGFPGALTSAAGNVTFADIQDLLNAGGSVQGATNPTASNPLGAVGGPGGTGAIGSGGGTAGAVVQDPTAVQQNNRGLGSTGAF